MLCEGDRRCAREIDFVGGRRSTLCEGDRRWAREIDDPADARALDRKWADWAKGRAGDDDDDDINAAITAPLPDFFFRCKRCKTVHSCKRGRGVSREGVSQLYHCLSHGGLDESQPFCLSARMKTRHAH